MGTTCTLRPLTNHSFSFANTEKPKEFKSDIFQRLFLTLKKDRNYYLDEFHLNYFENPDVKKLIDEQKEETPSDEFLRFEEDVCKHLKPFFSNVPETDKLFFAAESNLPKFIKTFFPIDERDESYVDNLLKKTAFNKTGTVWHAAAEKENVYFIAEMAKHLTYFEKKLNIFRLLDFDNETIAHKAAKAGSLGFFQWMSSIPETRAYHIFPTPPKARYNPLQLALLNGDKDLCDFLINFKGMTKNFLLQRNKLGESIFHITSFNEQKDFFESAIDLFHVTKEEIMQKDHHLKTPIHYAAGGCDQTIFKLLVDRFKIDTSEFNEPDINGVKPIDYAALYNDKECCDFLCKLKEMNAQQLMQPDKEGNNALHIAVTYGHEEVCQSFIDLGLTNKDLMQVDSDGKTVFHIAAENRSLKIFKDLASHPEISAEDLNQRDKRNKRPLDYVQEKCLLEFLQFLIPAKKITFQICMQPDDFGWNLLHTVALIGNTDIWDFLMDLNEMTIDDLLQTNESGSSPISTAVYHGKLNMLKRMVQFPGMTLDHIMHADRKENPIYNAAAGGHKNILNYFFNELELPMEKALQSDLDGWTLFHYAAANGHKSIFEYFHKNLGVPIKDTLKKDIEGRTPLHYAAVNGHKSIFEYFLNDLDLPVEQVMQKDNRGQTPLHCAAKNTYKPNYFFFERHPKITNHYFTMLDDDSNTPEGLAKLSEHKASIADDIYF